MSVILDSTSNFNYLEDRDDVKCGISQAHKEATKMVGSPELGLNSSFHVSASQQYYLCPQGNVKSNVRCLRYTGDARWRED